MELTVGDIQGGRQYLVGTVAELLVYSAVSEAQRAAVQAYLMRKYFLPGPEQAPKLDIRQTQGTLEITWTGSATLESAEQLRGTWRDVPEAKSPQSVAPSETARSGPVQDPGALQSSLCGAVDRGEPKRGGDTFS
jgi:hypothetical protein